MSHAQSRNARRRANKAKGAIGQTFDYNRNRQGAGQQSSSGPTAPTQPSTAPIAVAPTQPTPKAPRTVQWTPLAASVLVGTKLTPAMFNATATAGVDPVIIVQPADAMATAVGTLTVVLGFPPSTNFADTPVTAKVQVVPPPPRTVNWTPPAAPVLIGTRLTPELFGATPTAGTDPVRILQPADGMAKLAGPLTVELGFTASPAFTDTPVTTQIDIVPPVRDISWNPPATLVYGATLTLADVQGAATLEGGDPVLSITPAVPQVGSPCTLRIFAAGKPGLSRESEKTHPLTITKAPRTINFTPPAASAPIKTGEVLTALRFAATQSAGPDPVEVSAPAGGQVLTCGTVTIVLSLPTNANYDDASETFDVMVEKGTPVLTWARPAPISKGTALDNTQLNATAVPAAITPRLVYTVVVKDKTVPAMNQVMDSPGHHFITARFAGDAHFLPAEAEVRMTVCKNAAEKLGADAMLPANIAANWAKPTDAAFNLVETAWNADTGGIKTQAKDIMAKINTMTEREIKKYCDALPGATYSAAEAGVPQHIWNLPNGLRLRLKPEGDGRHTLSKMFSIEAMKATSFPNPLHNVAFKVTADGEPAPRDPGQFVWPNGNADFQSDFKLAASNATHLKCQPMQFNTITWALADGTEIPRATDLSASVLTATALGDAAISYKIGKLVVQNNQVMLAGAEKLSAISAETDKFKETTVSRSVKLVTAK
jgi:hypothetical protein